MKNTALFALLLVFALSVSTPTVAKQVQAQTTQQVKSSSSSCSQSSCCEEADDSCCNATSGTACSWLATTWCSAKSWVMNLFCANKCAAPADDIQITAEAEQDPEASNIPFQE